MRVDAHKAKAAKIAKALLEPVNTLLMTMALAELEREKCNAIQAKVLSEGRYVGRYPNGKEFIVTEPKRAFMMSTHDHGQWWARVDAEYRRAGMTIEEYGQCPALVAEHLQVQAEWIVIKEAEEFFPGVTNDKLLCGDGKKAGLELRREYLDLLIKLVVNAPGYRQPMKQATVSV